MDRSDTVQTVVQTFVLKDLPAGTPPDATFFLKTAQEGWHHGREELKFQPEDGRPVLRRAYTVGTLLAYKVTRETPDSEEGDDWGQRRPDRFAVVQGEGMHTLSVQSWQDGPQQPRPSTLSGHTETFVLHSPELQDDFTVTVWLPPQSGQSGARFPVLYLHDGQNVFDVRSSFAGVEWSGDEAAQCLAETGLPCLMVAVTVRSDHRAADYVPFQLAADGPVSSAADYQRFLADTLKPHIDATYPTLPDARNTAQAGSSFGGVASLYGGLSRPELWGTVGAFSPSLWVQDGALLGWSAHHPAPETRLYLDMGTLEGSDLTEAAGLVDLTRRYAAGMNGRVREVQLVIGDGHRHDEAAWADRFPGFLRWWLTPSP